MLTKLSLALFLLGACTGQARAGSWYFNQNGGFGIYQPLGWTIEENGRSAVLKGPERDSAQSEIFLGSDWISAAKDVPSLKTYLERNYPGQTFAPTRVSELEGFVSGSNDHQSEFIFRSPENIIEIDIDIRGSKAQKDEAREALSSIEIRTGGRSYP